MIGGYYMTQAIHVAATLGIADRLVDGPLSAGQLARETGSQPQALHRLLRTLAGFGIFAEEAGRFRLTELADLLRSDVPGSLRGVALTVGETHYPAFGKLLHSVQTGQAGFDKVFGVPLFDYFAVNPESARTFDAALEGLRSQASAAMLDAVDFSDVTTLVDVGGGSGGLLSAVLASYPSVNGVLFDLPHVIERASAVGDRCALVGGDFFESVPAGGDVYLLRHIIHDWDDEKAIRILRNCRQAMDVSARLLLVESVIRPGNEPSLGKFLDLVMLALTGGRERTEPEYRQLLQTVGFRLARVIPTSAGFDVIEALPSETGEE
jgi:hypothetical protein